MKLAITTITLLFSGAIAFAPSTPVRQGVASVTTAQTTALFAGPEEEEEGGLDLDLEEMFGMYVSLSWFLSGTIQESESEIRGRSIGKSDVRCTHLMAFGANINVQSRGMQYCVKSLASP